jgi:phosphoenolpyruvate-protein kinase (PTS system EI component)
LLLPFFLGLGIRKFSVEPKHIPAIKERVSDLFLEDAREYARHVLSMPKLEEVRTFLYGRSDV